MIDIAARSHSPLRVRNSLIPNPNLVVALRATWQWWPQPTGGADRRLLPFPRRGHGVNFIGPNPDNIHVMRGKSTARETMKKAGVPTVPASDGLLQSTKEAVKLAHEIGLLVMIKQAKSEATAAFGNDRVYLEKYIQNPRHIEFQIASFSVEEQVIMKYNRSLSGAYSASILEGLFAGIGFGVGFKMNLLII